MPDIHILEEGIFDLWLSRREDHEFESYKKTVKTIAEKIGK